MTGATAEESSSQNNATSTGNTRGGHFPHFGMIGANLFREFETFGGNNNNNSPLRNNNNNNLLLLLPPGFEGGLEEDLTHYLKKMLED